MKKFEHVIEAVLPVLWLIVIILFLILVTITVFPKSDSLLAASRIAPIIGTFIALCAVTIAAAEYFRKRPIDRKESQPYIVVSLSPKQTSQTIFELVVRSTGKTLAKNVSVTFNPDYSPFEGVRTMNSTGILNNLGVLTPGEERRYFFGSYNSPEGKHSIKRPFTILVGYQDVSGNTYNGEFVQDPTDYDGMIQNGQKGVNDVHKAIEELTKAVKIGSEAQSQIGKVLIEDGIRVRNLRTTNQSADELHRMIVNIYEGWHEDESLFSPFLYDYKLTIQQYRDALLAGSTPDNQHKELINNLNLVLLKDWRWDEDEVRKSFEYIKSSLSE